VADDAATAGAADWIAARAARRARTEAIELTAEDALVVRLFYALSSQWRTHPTAGVRLGLDYAAIRPTADNMGLTMTPGIFADLQTMEGAALAAFARS